jgi:hypothetical protein
MTTHHALWDALMTATLTSETVEQAFIADDFARIDDYINVPVTLIAAYPQPSDYRERPYAYCVVNDGNGPRITLTGDNAGRMALHWAETGRLPMRCKLIHYAADHGGYVRYWRKLKAGTE